MNREQAQAAIIAAVPAPLKQTAAVYISEGTWRAGDVVSFDRQPFTVPRDLFLGFVDLHAGRNWAHACLYILCNVADNQMETRPGGLPPLLPGGRRLICIAAGEDVPDWAVIRAIDSR